MGGVAVRVAAGARVGTKGVEVAVRVTAGARVGTKGVEVAVRVTAGARVGTAAAGVDVATPPAGVDVAAPPAAVGSATEVAAGEVAAADAGVPGSDVAAAWAVPVAAGVAVRTIVAVGLGVPFPSSSPQAARARATMKAAVTERRTRSMEPSFGSGQAPASWQKVSKASTRRRAHRPPKGKRYRWRGGLALLARELVPTDVGASSSRPRKQKSPTIHRAPEELNGVPYSIISRPRLTLMALSTWLIFRW
jgi:hypothetical protein